MFNSRNLIHGITVVAAATTAVIAAAQEKTVEQTPSLNGATITPLVTIIDPSTLNPAIFKQEAIRPGSDVNVERIPSTVSTNFHAALTNLVQLRNQLHQLRRSPEFGSLNPPSKVPASTLNLLDDIGKCANSFTNLVAKVKKGEELGQSNVKPREEELQRISFTVDRFYEISHPKEDISSKIIARRLAKLDDQMVSTFRAFVPIDAAPLRFNDTFK